MTTQFLVAVPYAEGPARKPADQFNTFAKKLDPQPVQFNLPQLKVGTLDSLMECSDEMVKIDASSQNIVYKMLNFLEEISGGEQSKEMLATVLKPDGQQDPVDVYVTNFRWNEAQYPSTKPVRQLIQTIYEQLMKNEDNVRTKMNEFNDLRQKISNVQKRGSGSLSVRPIGKLVKSVLGDDVLDTEYLVTLFVALPASMEKEWYKTYAKLGGIDFIVPDSSKTIAKDADTALVSVVLFKKFADAFKNVCREKKWMVRDFQEGDELTDEQVKQLEAERDQKKAALQRYLKSAFSECYSGWIHMKAARLFVESVLKYGLPPEFSCMLFSISPSKEKAARKSLANAFSHIPKTTMSDEADDLNALEQHYYYVSLRVATLSDVSK